VRVPVVLVACVVSVVSTPESRGRIKCVSVP
jgi:hypothetical protein